ncbi:MAG: bifunctional folylpolyglutamate synthase/dihydrofolate synthase [Candidatus Rokuibacteriota bacterium]|nr:MAG: bifunctional folylpolyglutamate synthase/dihydrofolate synthase [Candidatus Rokubacteria bacterium]
MTYAEALARLLALRGGEHAGMRPGLERIEALLDALGHPERVYTIVQIGGTNGKGSVASMLAAMLRAAGRRVGLYTSPHLVSFRERIRVDAEPIGEDALADGVEALGTLIARLDASVFEATTALALDHFAREGVEVAVLEVGLGGRFDSTTVGAPAVSVLTSIDLDHQEYLGHTLREIATDKAHIVRSGVAISAAQAPEAAAVIAARAAAVGVPLLREGHELRVAVRERTLAGQRLDCAGPTFKLDDLRIRLLGTYQPGNTLLAVAAARALDVDERAIREGLARARWPGRFDVRPRPGGWLVLDGAHNPAGARALADSLRTYFGDAPTTFVLGVLRDKDAAGIMTPLLGRAARLVLTKSANPRAAAPEDLRAVAPAALPVVVTPSVSEALALAEGPPATPILCVTGSLALVGDALRAGSGGDKPCPVENAADSMGPLL